jgi:ABC-type nitrate/sulfonate/bicarbonate transport system permease component
VAASSLDVGVVPRRGVDWKRSLGQYVPPIASLSAFIALWFALVALLDPNPRLFPGPVDVARELREVWTMGLLVPAFLDSMRALAVGLGLALIVGTVVGLLIGMSRIGDLIAAPYLWAYFATPDIALAPLVILWLGFGFKAKTWMIFFAAAVPLMLACKEGVQSVDGSLVRAARSFGASRLRLFRSVMMPATMPFIGTGVRNAISRGFVGLLVIEMTVGSGGLGTQVVRAGARFNAARMYAFIAVLVAIALVLISASRRFERFTSRWREQVSL